MTEEQIVQLKRDGMRTALREEFCQKMHDIKMIADSLVGHSIETMQQGFAAKSPFQTLRALVDDCEQLFKEATKI